jgi:quercetin dioxygenase-like cupin family protein
LADKPYKVITRQEAPDILGDYPGEMRMYTYPLDAEQVAFTYRRMPAGTGSKGSYGHRHKEQEEIFFVISGKLEFKLDEDVFEAEAGTAVRVPPPVVRGVWNEGPEDAELAICSIRIADPGGDTETVDGFWPAD